MTDIVTEKVRHRDASSHLVPGQLSRFLLQIPDHILEPEEVADVLELCEFDADVRSAGDGQDDAGQGCGQQIQGMGQPWND